MLRTYLILLSIFYSCVINAQSTGEVKAYNLASVKVTVTDRKGKPSKGEQIIFKGASTNSFFNGKSDVNGRFTIQLPVGEKYMISIKSLTDSTKYGMLEIPPLAEDEVYNEPFTVDVQFEPARMYTLDNVYFDVGKATLRPESFSELDELIHYLKNKELIRIEIAGHTDNVGKDADNLKLSQQRAETIRGYLVNKGIQSGRVVAKGYGASQPVADNSSEDGRKLNRRTEVNIL